jgi:hypothetical protein
MLYGSILLDHLRHRVIHNAMDTCLGCTVTAQRAARRHGLVGDGMLHVTMCMETCVCACEWMLAVLGDMAVSSPGARESEAADVGATQASRQRGPRIRFTFTRLRD